MARNVFTASHKGVPSGAGACRFSLSCHATYIWRGKDGGFLDAPHIGSDSLTNRGRTMITIYFDVATCFIDHIESYEHLYRKNKEVSALLSQLDIDYEPDADAEFRDLETYENSNTFVKIAGDARVIDQLVGALRGGYDDILDTWIEDGPWFLSEAVELDNMDGAEAAFLAQKYGDIAAAA